MRAAEAGAGIGPTGSMLALDDRGVGLRATWRLEHGFVNLSLWRDDRCVETFHLTPADAARFVSFFVDGLAAVAVAGPAAPPLRLVEEASAPGSGRARRLIARVLRHAADRLVL